MGGGTNLAIRYGHRQSVDIDLSGHKNWLSLHKKDGAN
ncbi:nucleotidyl transferase AbiEii/AbiGii toxin family protein [Pararcticibacter amylolyticus]